MGTNQHDVIRFVSYFEAHGQFAKGCNSSFITLIPKVKDQLSLGDYRHISLIGCMYKIIAKILAVRIKPLISSVVDEVQSAYLEGRHILEAPLIVNGICSWAKKRKRKDFLIKSGLQEGVRFNKLGISRLDHETNGIQSQMAEVDSWMSIIFESHCTYKQISLRRVYHNQRSTARRPTLFFHFLSWQWKV